MFSIKPLLEESRTIAKIVNIKTKKVMETIWYTEKSRQLKNVINNFNLDIEEYIQSHKNGWYQLKPKYNYKMTTHNKVTEAFPRFVNYYLASSNSGKSYTIARLCEEYVKNFPNNPIIYASANPITNDINYAKLYEDNKIIELDLMATPGILKFEEFKDVLFIFDDCDSVFSTNMQDVDERLTDAVVKEMSIGDRSKARKMMQSKTQDITSNVDASIKSLMKNGRKNNISICIVAHKFNDGISQMNVLSESDGVTLFPYSVQKNILKTFLMNKLTFDKEDAKEICDREFYQYDFLFCSNKGKKFIFTNEALKLFE